MDEQQRGQFAEEKGGSKFSSLIYYHAQRFCKNMLLPG